MKTCPGCGSSLFAAYREYVTYPVSNIAEDGSSIDVEAHNGDHHDSRFLHLACEKCGRYWYSLGDFINAVKEAKAPTTTDVEKVSFVALGPENIDSDGTVHAGDKIRCPLCNKWHKLCAGKDSNGNTTETLLAYRCKKESYVAAINNKLIKWPAGTKITTYQTKKIKKEEKNDK